MSHRPVDPDLARLWPAAALSVRAGDLELRWMDDALLLDVADLAGQGIHADGATPFTVPWTQGTPDQVARNALTYQWSARNQVSPQVLVLELAVLRDGKPVGVQAAHSTNWAVLKEAETGSWLGLDYHGQGIGTRMRIMMLALMFDGLGAAHITSAAYDDNGPSNAVSRKAGYQPDGLLRDVRQGEAAILNRWRMTRERWSEVRDHNLGVLGAPLVIDGAEAVREQIQEA
ncbi:GNAT family N-acetyltransferase [Demequina sp. B12]|uniref:GNAT family N-acetyltransferase n=1 Tax=Demequina sp. B12 TaxID=2992757 RepID=UPI00237C40F5|nr:GNAT family protein [Demequina sp. B12]MDE0572478.1 GNAT family N-acetyltransferase [Demequina sp. B12]